MPLRIAETPQLDKERNLSSLFHEARIWCASLDPAGLPGCTRSLALVEGIPTLSVAECSEEIGEIVGRHPEVVDQVVVARRRHLAHRQDIGTSGRMIVVDFSVDIGLPAAQRESGGFFDLSSCPGWDTWITVVTNIGDHKLLQPLLVAWVPQSMQEAVGRAVPDALGTICWLEDFLKEDRYGSRRVMRQLLH